MGWDALLIALVLISVEVAFSFDNAIVNAKILKQMSRFWQVMFLTVGAAIAIFGMRLVFPIILVALTAGLGWQEVIDLALHHPEEYAHKLEESHVVLSAFGGSFLLMLALHFFLDDSREVLWYVRLERGLQRLAYHWAPAVGALVALVIVTFLPRRTIKIVNERTQSAPTPRPIAIKTTSFVIAKAPITPSRLKLASSTSRYKKDIKPAMPER